MSEQVLGNLELTRKMKELEDRLAKVEAALKPEAEAPAKPSKKKPQE